MAEERILSGCLILFCRSESIGSPDRQRSWMQLRYYLVAGPSFAFLHLTLHVVQQRFALKLLLLLLRERLFTFVSTMAICAQR